MQTYRKYVWKICSINRETNIGQGGWILCGIQRAAGRQYWQKEDMWKNGHCGRQKLSSGMAMVLGALLTMEIMLGGAMLFNFDFRGADIVAVVLSFMVLYFAVVASLTDK